MGTIEWTDRSDWNPVRGCTRVSPGCGGPGPNGGCYAEAMAARFSDPGMWGHGIAERTAAGGRWTGKVEIQWDRIDLPLRWRRPARIFANSTSDLFHAALSAEEIATIYAVAVAAVHVRGHTLQILTKRPERMREILNSEAFWSQVNAEAGALVMEHTDPLARRSDDARTTLDDYGPQNPPPGIWLGTSTENQPCADERIPELLATPAAVRFVSGEPLLGPLDLRAFLPKWIRGPVRPWDTFHWPEWVPDQVRQQIVSFWNPEWTHGPNAWMQGAADNGQPPLGTRGRYHAGRQGEPLVEGRFIPAWNNIGRVVDDAGAVHVVSAGIYQSRSARLDWVIAGGESGPRARPMHPDWARSLRDQCGDAGVPFFFKQWGEWIDWRQAGASRLVNVTPQRPSYDGPYVARLYATGSETALFDGRAITTDMPAAGSTIMCRVGKKAAGRLLDGIEHNGMPAA